MLTLYDPTPLPPASVGPIPFPWELRNFFQDLSGTVSTHIFPDLIRGAEKAGLGRERTKRQR